MTTKRRNADLAPWAELIANDEDLASWAEQIVKGDKEKRNETRVLLYLKYEHIPINFGGPVITSTAGEKNGPALHIVFVEPECSEVINGPNLGGFLGLAPNLRRLGRQGLAWLSGTQGLPDLAFPKERLEDPARGGGSFVECG